ncbi:MAG TPA: hypothetical protein VI072_32415 [Polyangiaceae bacterium]
MFEAIPFHAARCRALAALLALLCASSGCSHSVRVRHEVPLAAPEARTCAERCFETRPRGTRAACLRRCPGARELEDASCARVDKKRVACAEERRQQAGVSPLLAILGATLVMNVLVVFTILVD